MIVKNFLQLLEKTSLVDSQQTGMCVCAPKLAVRDTNKTLEKCNWNFDKTVNLEYLNYPKLISHVKESRIDTKNFRWKKFWQKNEISSTFTNVLKCWGSFVEQWIRQNWYDGLFFSNGSVCCFSFALNCVFHHFFSSFCFSFWRNFFTIILKHYSQQPHNYILLRVQKLCSTPRYCFLS